MDNAARPLELWLPDLPRFDPSHPLRTLLARADRIEDGAKGYLAGLASYFSCAGDFSPAALTRELIAGDAADAAWLCADPAWIQPDLNGARLLACGQLQLSAEDAQALARPLKPVFGDAGMILEVTSPDRWHVRLSPNSPVPEFAAPEQALGEDLYQHLPQGVDGRRWRALLTEVQVLLHQHPLNAERRARGLAPVNSLWLWGGGRLPTRVTSGLAAVVGDDVLLSALARRAGVTALPRTPASVGQARPGWLIDLQDLPVDDIAQSWWPLLQPLVAKQPMQLSFASGERWLYRPWHRFRFWRGGGR
ncbi:phosphoglycerate mutase [Dyella subtropica]|uniref:phosphoglycerate mutase n=1 Tax=Dyella subtropica TaxID=2992127 RepID=UPI002253B5F6|nr:phosphoglycerate mutase [Dyella subtropica]